MSRVAMAFGARNLFRTPARASHGTNRFIHGFSITLYHAGYDTRGPTPLETVSPFLAWTIPARNNATRQRRGVVRV